MLLTHRGKYFWTVVVVVVVVGSRDNRYRWWCQEILDIGGAGWSKGNIDGEMRTGK